MANISTIIKSKFFKKSRTKKIEKLEAELGFIQPTKNTEPLKFDPAYIILIPLLLIFVGLIVWVIGGAISLCSFIWETGGIFDRIMILFFDVAVIVFVGGFIYTVIKSE